jgi:hypothetical protein
LHSTAGLPDGLFPYQKSQFRYIFENLGVENVGMFYGYLIYLKAIWLISWAFGIFCGHLVYFSLFWYVVPRKIWQPCSTAEFPCKNVSSPEGSS